MELLILGSNSAAFAYGRHHTAQILKYESKYFLIDCGEGTQIQMRRFQVKLSKLHCILISHLHGDHYLGLTGLLNTLHLYGRKTKLTVVGPPGLREILSLQFKMSRTTLTYPIQFIEWKPNENHVVYEDKKLTIETIPLEHKIDCSGYLIREKPKRRRINRQMLPEQLAPAEIRKLKNGEDVLDLSGEIKFHHDKVTLPPKKSLSYAFCSDTKYLPRLSKQVQGVDLLYHESSFLDEMVDRAEMTKHSTAAQAALIAKEANAGKLLLGHFSSRYRKLDEFLEESKPIFENTHLAIEGETFNVEA